MDNDRHLIERVVVLETEHRVRMDRLEKELVEIHRNLTELRALANQGKGSLRTFLWMGGLSVTLIGLAGTILGAIGVKFGG